jgi:hypothetical protein
MTLSLVVLIVLMVLSTVLSFFLKEPKILLTECAKPGDTA